MGPPGTMLLGPPGTMLLGPPGTVLVPPPGTVLVPPPGTVLDVLPGTVLDVLPSTVPDTVWRPVWTLSGDQSGPCLETSLDPVLEVNWSISGSKLVHFRVKSGQIMAKYGQIWSKSRYIRVLD